jgi:hypothetical protein
MRSTMSATEWRAPGKDEEHEADLEVRAPD